jgi:tetratricopeptide (TPR) repeat protein
VEHIFSYGGQRQITVQACDGQTCVATNVLRVHVVPNWLQRDEWHQGIFDEAKRGFMSRDLSRIPARDLVEVLHLADRVDDKQLIARMGENMLKRPEDFNTPVYGPTYYKLGLNFEHAGDSGNQLAERAFRLAVTPERKTAAVIDKARLRIADLLIHSGSLDEGERLLTSLSMSGLSMDERRLSRLLQGDLLLARGRVEEAKKHYAEIGNIGKRPAAGSGVGRDAVLESASISLQRGDYEEAASTLNLLIVEHPLERLAVDVGLLRLNLDLKQKEFAVAFELCRALSLVAERDPHKAGLLLGLVESGLALGKHDQAQQALRELTKTFPYSEQAAKAKALAGP